MILTLDGGIVALLANFLSVIALLSCGLSYLILFLLPETALMLLTDILPSLQIAATSGFGLQEPALVNVILSQAPGSDMEAISTSLNSRGYLLALFPTANSITLTMAMTIAVFVFLWTLVTGLSWQGHVPKETSNSPRQTSCPSAQDLLSKSLAALGGEQALKALKGVTYNA